MHSRVRSTGTHTLPNKALNHCVREEARFSALELTPTGIELAELAFASGQELDGDARRWLKDWIEEGDKDTKKVCYSAEVAPIGVTSTGAQWVA